MSTSVDIRNFTRRKAPGLRYADMAQAVLPGWELSLVFAGRTRAQSLNRRLRNKTYIPNVLSYESGKKSGEIIICLDVAESQAPSYGMSYRTFVGYLFIHGLLHLKGHPHGPTMERYEGDLVSRFIGVTTKDGATHRNRNRSRHTPDESRGGRRGRHA